MGMKQCPVCELNYIDDSKSICDVCVRLRSRAISNEPVICSECGENEAMPGEELCYNCSCEKEIEAIPEPEFVSETTDSSGIEKRIEIELPLDEIIPQSDSESLSRFSMDEDDDDDDDDEDDVWDDDESDDDDEYDEYD